MRKLGLVALSAVVLLLGVVSVFPLLSVLLNSFTDPNMLSLSAENPSKLIFVPFPISLKQYYGSILGTRETLHFFWNSVILTVPTLAGGLFFSLLSGYALSKFQFPGRRIIFFCYVLLMLLPIQINVVGSYLLLDKLHLIGSYLGVILPGVFSPFGAFLIYQFMKSVPQDTMESGRLDGAGEITLLVKIVLPQVKAGIASMIILMLIDCWNMVEMPMAILKEERLYPLSVMLRYVNVSDPKIIYASTVVFTIPLLLVFLLFRRDLTNGIVQSAEIKA